MTNTTQAMKRYPVDYLVMAQNILSKCDIGGTVTETMNALMKLKDYTLSKESGKNRRHWIAFVMRYQYMLTFRCISEVLGYTMTSARQLSLRELNDLKEILNDKFEVTE